MKCPKCQAENSETRKFCSKCGAKLALVCAKCGFENIPEDKFCGECGENLSLPSIETFKLTEGFFRFESLGEKQVKGKEEPVKVYQVTLVQIRFLKTPLSWTA